MLREIQRTPALSPGYLREAFDNGCLLQRQATKLKADQSWLGFNGVYSETDRRNGGRAGKTIDKWVAN